MATEEPTRFVVATPQRLLDYFRRWAGQAATAGVLSEFIAALKDANRRMEMAPHGWGDLLREYPGLNAVKRRGLIPGWFLVWYGVDDNAHHVIVLDLLPAPGSPLTDTPSDG